jgi:hypothetical protein
MKGIRETRIERYNRPGDWVSGIADPAAKNLPGWSKRASDNSEIAPRAKGGKMDLPSTGKAMHLRSTASKPKGHGVDPYDRARSDLNSYGSSFMKGIRREA